jgi:hypothetical protein
MKRRKGVKIPMPVQPPGYAFYLHNKGDEQDWAVIETSVGEFPNADKELLYF